MTARIFERNNGQWGVLIDGVDGYHVTQNPATQLFTVWSFDDEPIADNVGRHEAERLAAEAWAKE